MEVDSVDEGAGDFAGVLHTLRGAGDAFFFGEASEAAGARVHGSDEDGFGGEGDAGLDSADGDDAVLERLS